MVPPMRRTRHVICGWLLAGGLGAGCLGSSLEVESPAPVADAGFDQVRYLGDRDSIVVQLDGRASCDPLGDLIDRAIWTMEDAPLNSYDEVSIAQDMRAIFVANDPGTYLVSLKIQVADRESPADFVAVEVRAGEGEDVVVSPPSTDACGQDI